MLKGNQKANPDLYPPTNRSLLQAQWLSGYPLFLITDNTTAHPMGQFIRAQMGQHH
jgi:hypothetical protein